MSQVTEQSVRFQTALASIKLIQASAVLELKDGGFAFLSKKKVWIATDRSRARRCVEACVYGTLDFVGYPRFPAPVEFIAAVIAYYVHPVNIQTACLIMEGAEFTESIINGVERPVKAAELFAFFFSIRRRHTSCSRDWSSDVCSSDLGAASPRRAPARRRRRPGPHWTASAAGDPKPGAAPPRPAIRRCPPPARPHRRAPSPRRAVLDRKSVV